MTSDESLETVVAEVINDLYETEEVAKTPPMDNSLFLIQDARQKLERAVQGGEDGEM